MLASEISSDNGREILKFHEVPSAVNALRLFHNNLSSMYPGDSEIISELITTARKQLEQRMWWVTTSKIQSEIKRSDAAQVAWVRSMLRDIVGERLNHLQEPSDAKCRVYFGAWWLIVRM